jgi:cytochrome c-type biogenesis protein CcmH/NrfG
MKSESIAFAVAGVLFGLLVGWIIGSQQTPVRQPAASARSNSPAATSNPQPAPIDESQVNALRASAERQPSDAAPRAKLGNLYFDAERFEDAIVWYTEALSLAPNDVNVSTDLGVSYYYSNQPDRALAQFSRSLEIDPTHTKTILNMGIVKAFGKQDLEGAAEAWTRVVELAPDSPEGQAARGALERLRSGHSDTGQAAKPGT